MIRPVLKRKLCGMCNIEYPILSAASGQARRSGLAALPFQVPVASSLLSCFIKADMAGYTGGFASQISGLIREIKPAGQVLYEMVAQTADILIREMPQEAIVKQFRFQ